MSEQQPAQRLVEAQVRGYACLEPECRHAWPARNKRAPVTGNKKRLQCSRCGNVNPATITEAWIPGCHCGHCDIVWPITAKVARRGVVQCKGCHASQVMSPEWAARVLAAASPQARAA